MVRRLALVGSIFFHLAVAHATTAAADVYRDLIKGTPAERGDAALEVLRKPERFARGTIRRAMVAMARDPRSTVMPHITKILEDAELDVATRGAAALALGVIGRDHPDIWPPGEGDPKVHRPLPLFAKKALEHCLDAGTTRTVRRACAEALGLARVDESLDELEAILDNPAEDAVLRVFAGRAVSRITGTLAVSAASLEALVTSVKSGKIP
jgi:HEAT repeat protein